MKAITIGSMLILVSAILYGVVLNATSNAMMISAGVFRRDVITEQFWNVYSPELTVALIASIIGLALIIWGSFDKRKTNLAG